MKNFNRIFNIGFNKCGTKTLGKALQMLGFNTVHFKHNGVRLYDIMQSNIRNGRELLCGIEHYDAFSDFAGQYIFKALDVHYPGSKFILTVRNIDDWLDSREAHVLRNRMSSDYQHFFLSVDRDQWTRDYQQILHEVKNHFFERQDDLLILDIPGGDKWEKICSFTGAEIPADAFPHENSRLLKSDAGN